MAELPLPPPSHRAILTLELSSVKELSSAQQRMYELNITRVLLSPCHRSPTDGQSLSFPISTNHSSSLCEPSNRHLLTILQSLKESNNRLIIRQWKRGASWLNCNTNNGWVGYMARGAVNAQSISALDSEENRTTLRMAKAEVEGYRLARLALNGSTYVAEVLFFSHDHEWCQVPLDMNIVDSHTSEKDSNRKDEFVEPWVVLSYFDHETFVHEKEFTDTSDIRLDDNLRLDLQLEARHFLPSTDHYKPCHHYVSTMVKTRHEFGFDEPHPRHGRVPIEESLDYTLMILRDVVFPLQHYFFTERLDIHKEADLVNIACIDREDEKRGALLEAKPFQYLDMVSMYRHVLNRLSTNYCNMNDGRTKTMLDTLQKCVTTLQDEWKSSTNSSLPPVLCHLDLQPQNLAFWHKAKIECTNHDATNCRVAAVMDWEEACYADPRFELILLCRKVLANREQAGVVWQFYSEQVQKWKHDIMSQCNKHEDWEVGPIEPWLKLECVHSLCTLIIQLLDSVGGGRSPWETKCDLIGKMERERRRLVMMGWTFCAIESQ
jgi:hypothetical protein